MLRHDAIQLLRATIEKLLNSRGNCEFGNLELAKFKVTDEDASKLSKAIKLLEIDLEPYFAPPGEIDCPNCGGSLLTETKNILGTLRFIVCQGFCKNCWAIMTGPEDR